MSCGKGVCDMGMDAVVESVRGGKVLPVMEDRPPRKMAAEEFLAGGCALLWRGMPRMPGTSFPRPRSRETLRMSLLRDREPEMW